MILNRIAGSFLVLAGIFGFFTVADDLLVANCILSVAGAVLVPLFPGWVLTPLGMLVGGGWNVLIAVVMVLVMLEFRFGKTSGNQISEVADG